MSIAGIQCPRCGHTIQAATTFRTGRVDARPCGCGSIVTIAYPTTPTRIAAGVAAHQRDPAHRAWIDSGGLER